MKTLIAYCDGGSKGNPGNAAFGYVIYNNKNEIILQKAKYIGISTNNIAEYMSIFECIKDAINIGFDNLIIRSDSQLAIKQLNNLYNIKNINLLKIYQKIKEITVNKNIVYEHIPREKNRYADMLLNQILKSYRNS